MTITYYLKNIHGEMDGRAALYNWLEFMQGNTYIKEHESVASLFIG